MKGSGGVATFLRQERLPTGLCYVITPPDKSKRETKDLLQLTKTNQFTTRTLLWIRQTEPKVGWGLASSARFVV